MGAADELTVALEALEGRALLVVTGAGVSSASGIPTFRGPEPGAVWKLSPQELATWDYFQRDPLGHWCWYLERFSSVERAEPNAAHLALARLERWCAGRGADFRLVTQNIDTLHERAGSQRMIKIHGTSDRVRCSRRGCEHGAPSGSIARRPQHLEALRRQPVEDHLPRCPTCGALLRPHVLFFDEYYQDHEDYRFAEAVEAAEQAAVMLFVGTSFSVGFTDLCLGSARRSGAVVLSIDPHAAPRPGLPGLRVLAEPAEDLLPEVCRRLEI